MKKVEKYIYLVIILILVVVIACSITYAITISNNNNESTNEQTNNEPSNNNESNNNNETNEEEQITLSESELEEYLSYVPDTYVSTSAYTTNDEEKLKNIILGYTLYEMSRTTLEIPASDVEEKLQERYNISLDEFELEIGEDYVASCGGTAFTYDGEVFIANEAGASNYNKISIIEEYEFDGSDLIIYERAATFWTYFYERGYYLGDYSQLIDFNGVEPNFTLIKLNIDYDTDNTSYARESAYNYLEDHKEAFTLYKHTFKKNSEGYYWVSTKVA